MIAATLVVGAQAAAADNVFVGPAQPVPAVYEFFGVACPTTSECLAVGEPASVETTSSTTGALVAVQAGVAGPEQDVTGVSSLLGIACMPLGDCLAVGGVSSQGSSSGALVPITAGQVGTPRPVSGVSYLTAITCLGEGDCLAVGGASGGSASVVPIVDGTAGLAQAITGVGSVVGVTCADSTTCFAVGGDTAGNPVIVSITDGSPTGFLPVPANVTRLDAITCASPSDCYAVGQNGGNLVLGDGVVLPITSGVVGAAEDVPGTTSLAGVACSNDTNCVAVGSLGQNQSLDDEPASVVVPITGGAVGSVQTFENPFSPPSGVACPANGQCVAAGMTFPGAGVVAGAVVPIQISGLLGPPVASIGAPGAGQTFGLNATTAPAYAFTCQPAFAGALAATGGCTGSVDGRVVTNGQALDTTHAGTFTLTVTATQTSGEQTVVTEPFTIAKGADSVFFPQIGPFLYRQAAVTLGAVAASGSPIIYTVAGGACAVSGSTLTFTGWGPCVVRADQPGTTNYTAASATSTITVAAPTPPVCAGLGLDVASGQAATVTLGCADAPSDGGDPLSIAVETLPAHGTLTAFDTATGSVTYTPTGDYTGPDSFTFDATDAQGVSSTATISIIVATQPASVAFPVVTGTAGLGRVLRCSTGTWSGTGPISYAYQWKRGTGVVAGRTAASYTLGAADLGHDIVCVVTARNAVGSAGAQSATLAVGLPSSAFTFGKVTTSSRGSLAVRLAVPGPGRLASVAKFALARQTVAGGGRAKADVGTYSNASAKASRSGALTLKLVPAKKARIALRTGRRIAVDVTVTFTPTDGKARTKTEEITF